MRSTGSTLYALVVLPGETDPEALAASVTIAVADFDDVTVEVLDEHGLGEFVADLVEKGARS